MNANASSDIDIRRVDYSDPSHQQHLVELLDSYARDPMGGGEALPKNTIDNLCAALAETAGAVSFIAYVDGAPAGLINSFMGFSTFKCAPLVNIHDVTVEKAFRGKGIATEMIAAVESLARERGCCKITLEVLTGNDVAKRAYEKIGFSGYEMDPVYGGAEFWQKLL